MCAKKVESKRLSPAASQRALCKETTELVRSLIRHYHAFEAASKDIESLIRTELPKVREAFGETGLDADVQKHLETCLKVLSDLEMQARARSVWAHNFGEYMREALSRND